MMSLDCKRGWSKEQVTFCTLYHRVTGFGERKLVDHAEFVWIRWEKMPPRDTIASSKAHQQRHRKNGTDVTFSSAELEICRLIVLHFSQTGPATEWPDGRLPRTTPARSSLYAPRCRTLSRPGQCWRGR